MFQNTHLAFYEKNYPIVVIILDRTWRFEIQFILNFFYISTTLSTVYNYMKLLLDTKFDKGNESTSMQFIFTIFFTINAS